MPPEHRRRLLTFSISLIFLIVIAIHSIGLAVARIRYFVIGAYVLCGFLWLMLLVRSKRKIQIPILTAPLAIIFVYQFILIVVSPVPFYGFEIALTGIFYLLVFIFFINSIEDFWDIDTWENALLGTAILFTLVDIVDIALWLRDWNAISGAILPLPPIGFRSEGSFLAHPNLMAAYINVILPLAITRLIFAKSSSKKAAWGILILYFVIIEHFASSRGAWLGAVLGIGLMLFLLNLKALTNRIPLQQRMQNLINTKTIVRALGILAVSSMVGIIFLKQVQISPGHGSGGSGRFDIWTNALNVFLSSPIWGNGPSSMRVLYAVEAGLPPGFSAGHGHNAILQIGGEFGVIGLALVGWLVWMVLRAFIRAWTIAPESTRPRLAGYAAIFTALTVHHVFDYAFELFPYTVGVLLILGLLVHHDSKGEKFSLKPVIWAPIMVGLLLVYVMGTLFTLRGSTKFQEGIDAAVDENWSIARDLICEAIEINPYVSHYAFQCSLAQARVADLEDNPESLAKSISTYEVGLQSDPYWPIHWANLAALEWETGERNNAVAHMQQALEAAPRNATIALNLGRMEEELGDINDAMMNYQLALELNPSFKESIFFVQNELRHQAIDSFEPIVIKTSSNSLAWAGWRALNEQQYSDAKEYLSHAIEISVNNARAYAWLARLHRETGDLDLAWYYANLGLFVDSNEPYAHIEAMRIAKEKGNMDVSTEHGYRAFKLMRDQNQSFEFASVFYMRPFLPFDLVPQLIDPKLSSSSVDEFEELAEYLNASGDIDEARSILKWIEDERD